MLLHGVANYIEIIWSLLKENNQLPYSYRITNDKFRSWKRAKMQKNGCAERDHNIAKEMFMWVGPINHTSRRVATRVSLMPGFWSTCEATGLNKVLPQCSASAT